MFRLEHGLYLRLNFYRELARAFMLYARTDLIVRVLVEIDMMV